MDANTRPSTFTLLRAALIAGTIFLLPTPGDAPMDAAVDDMFSSDPSSVHPSVSSLPPPNVGSEALDNVAVAIATSVDTFVNATVTSTGSRLPALAVEILKDLTGIVLEHAIVYCSVLGASVLVAIFVSFRRFVPVAPTRLGVRLSTCGRQIICLLWSVLEAIRCHLGRNTMLEDEITRLRTEPDEVTLRLVTAGAGSAGLKTLDEDSLPLTTADTEQQTEACVESQPSFVASLCDIANTDTVSTKVSDDERTRTSEKSLILDKSTLTGTQELDETIPYLVAAMTDEASLLPKTVMLEKEQHDASREARQAAQMELSGLRELVQSLESRLQATVNTLEETTLAKQVVEQDIALQTQTLTKDAERLAVSLQYAEGQAMEWQRRAIDSEARLEEEKAAVRRESQRADVAERKLEDAQTRLGALSEELVAAEAQIVESHAQAEDLEVQLRNEVLQGKKGRRREDTAKRGLRKAWSLIGTLSMKLKDERTKVGEVEAQISESQAKASLLKSAIEDERRSAELLSEESSRTTGTLTMKLLEEQTKVREVEALLLESQAKASLLKSAFEDERERGDSAILLLDEAHWTIGTLSAALTQEQTKVREVEAQVSESRAKASLLKSDLEDQMEWRDSANLLLDEAHKTIGTLSMALTEEQTKVHQVEALIEESQAKASGLELAFAEANHRADLAVQELEGAQDKIRSLSTELSEAQTKVPGVGAQLQVSQAKASDLDSALTKANRWAELARAKLNTQAKDIETLQCQVATVQSALEDETLRADLTAAMFSRSNESFVLLRKAVEEDKRRADDAEQRLEEVKYWIDKFLETVEAEKKEIAEATATETRRSQQVVTVLQASLQAETERANSAEDKVSAIQQEMDGLMKGAEEEMRGEYEMKVKLNDADSQAARAYQERQALVLDLDATKVNLSIAQQKIKALSEGSQELERQLLMTQEDNKRLADTMRCAHLNANVAKEEVQTISASTREEMIRKLMQRVEFLEKEKLIAEGRAKCNQKLTTFHSTNNRQLIRAMKIQQCSMGASIRQLQARLETMTKRANKLAKEKALEEKHRAQAKLSFRRLRSKQILDRHRSSGSAARRKPSPVTLPTTKTFETAKTEDERKTTLLEHPSFSAPKPDLISLCESPLRSQFETRGGLEDMVDIAHASVSADGLCIPECPPPSADLLRGPDDRDPSGLPELPKVPYTASFTTLETIPAWSPLEIVQTEAQLSVAEASESVVLLSGSDLPDLPSFPSGSVSWSRSLSRHGCAQVQEAGTPEASESVVLLSGSTLSDLPSFPSGSVSWSRSLPRTGLPATGVTRATESVPVRSSPERAVLPPSLLFPDSLGSCTDDIVSAASLMHDSPSNTSLSALPARSPRQLLTDPRVAARAGMEAMLRAQRREQQYCLSPTPGSRAVSCSVKDSTPTSCSPVISASVANAFQHERRPSMDSELSLMELFDVSSNVLTSTPRKSSGPQQKTIAESRSFGELEMSTLDMCPSFPALSIPYGMDAILPDSLVLPSIPVLTMGLEDSDCESSVLVPYLTDAPEADLVRGAALESSLTENEASVALPLANLLPANKDVPSSSGGRKDQTPATALASVLVGHMADKCGDGGEMDCDGRVRDARTLKFRKRSLEALQSRRIVSYRIGSRLPGQVG